jgi:protocatechuate 3,4-dioxygenase beta subunit
MEAVRAMRMRILTYVMAASLAPVARISFGDERATVTGKVVDAAGKPVRR